MADSDDFRNFEMVDFDTYADAIGASMAINPYGARSQTSDITTEVRWDKTTRSILGQTDVAIANDDDHLRRVLNRIARRTFIEFGPSSDMLRLISSTGYLEVIGLGIKVVPHLLRDMETTRRPWFVALAAIVRRDVARHVEPGDIRGMIEAWLNWGRRRKFL